MATRTCSVPGCRRPHLARGLCRSHYEQDVRRGRGLSVRVPLSPALVSALEERAPRPTLAASVLSVLTGWVRGAR